MSAFKRKGSHSGGGSWGTAKLDHKVASDRKLECDTFFEQVTKVIDALATGVDKVDLLDPECVNDKHGWVVEFFGGKNAPPRSPQQVSSTSKTAAAGDGSGNQIAAQVKTIADMTDAMDLGLKLKRKYLARNHSVVACNVLASF